MSTLLNQAIASLDLQPGQAYRTMVNGHEVEVRILEKPQSTAPHLQPSQFSDMVMLDLWLDIPPSLAARTMTVPRGEPMLPSPIALDGGCTFSRRKPTWDWAK